MNRIHHNAFIEIANFLRTAYFTSCTEEVEMIFFRTIGNWGYMNADSIVLLDGKDERIEISLNKSEYELLRSFLNPVKVTGELTGLEIPATDAE